MSVNTKLNKLKKDDLVAICSSKKVDIPASAKTKPTIIAFMIAFDKWPAPLETIVDEFIGGGTAAPEKVAAPKPTQNPIKSEIKATASTKSVIPTPSLAPAPSINIDEIVKQVTPKVLQEVLKQIPSSAPASKASTIITTDSNINTEEIMKKVSLEVTKQLAALAPKPTPTAPQAGQKTGGIDQAAFDNLSKRVNELNTTLQQLKQTPTPAVPPQKPANTIDSAAFENLSKKVNELSFTVQQLKQAPAQPQKPAGNVDASVLDNINKRINQIESKMTAQPIMTSKSAENKESKSEIRMMAEIMEAIPPEPTHLTDVYAFLENENIPQIKFQEMVKFLLMMGLIEGEESDDDLQIELADGTIIGEVKKK